MEINTFKINVLKKLEELRDSDKTIVIVSHALGSIEKLCKRGIWIHEGKIMKDGKIKTVIEDYLKTCN